MGERISGFGLLMGGSSQYEVALATQLQTLLPDIKTAADVKDWLGALTPSLCKIDPCLPLRLSERLAALLKEFTPHEVSECVRLCLDMAWIANPSGSQQSKAWANICAELHSLALPAMQALLGCLQDQGNRQQLPDNGRGAINHVNAVIGYMAELPGLEFGTVVVPIADAPPELHGNELIAIDEPMRLNRQVLKLAMAHALRQEGVDWMRPEVLPDMHQDARWQLGALALVDKYFSNCFSPMLANYPWIQTEVRTRREFLSIDLDQLSGQMDKLVHVLVDLPARTVESMVCVPGVAQRRLDMLLRALFLGANQNAVQGADASMWNAYLHLRDRAVVQMATRHQAMSPSFAQHVGLSTLPLQFMTMAYRMLGPEPQDFLPAIQWMAGDHLLAYPPDVQALTLLSLLSILPPPENKERERSRLEVLMADLSSWPTLPHEWLLCQSGYSSRGSPVHPEGGLWPLGSESPMQGVGGPTDRESVRPGPSPIDELLATYLTEARGGNLAPRVALALARQVAAIAA